MQTTLKSQIMSEVRLADSILICCTMEWPRYLIQSLHKLFYLIF